MKTLKAKLTNLLRWLRPSSCEISTFCEPISSADEAIGTSGEAIGPSGDAIPIVSPTPLVGRFFLARRFRYRSGGMVMKDRSYGYVEGTLRVAKLKAAGGAPWLLVPATEPPSPTVTYSALKD